MLMQTLGYAILPALRGGTILLESSKLASAVCNVLNEPPTAA
jgi:hypothetical protein